MRKGFTLIELLVVISIIGILIAISVFGLQGARKSSRDAKRKADLQQIRSALEIYKADCNQYPATASVVGGSSLVGGVTPAVASCPSSNTYVEEIPTDPIPSQQYSYNRIDESHYNLCAALEQGSGSVSNCGAGCASGTGVGVTCNFQVKQP